MREIAQVRVRYGYRKIRVLLNREGWKAGKKLVYRLYREEASPYETSRGGSVALGCIVASVSGPVPPIRCGVWIS
jgi:hypothetical protein